MTILARWQFGAAARAIGEMLRDTTSVAVVDHPAIAGLLGDGKRTVMAFAARGRLRSLRGRAARASGTALPVETGALAALVGAGASGKDWRERVAEWTRAVRDGGTVILVDRGARPELGRRALASGLVDLEQRAVSGIVITAGRVRL
jgi:hypothetical protein